MKTFIVAAVLFSSLSAVAQDQNEYVTVPKQYVSSEGMKYQKAPDPPTPEISKWAGIGKEIGDATKNALGAVVDQADRFGNSKVGTFIMVMVAWRIMAKDVLGIILGLPLLFIGWGFWVWAMKRFFVGYRVLDKVEGKTKVYADHPAYQFNSSDARVCAGSFAFLALVIYTGLMVFGVIF